MKRPIEPIKSTNLMYSFFDKDGKLTTRTNTFYYKDYGPNEYHKLPSVCKVDQTRKEFDEYQEYKRQMKWWIEQLQNRIDREMDIEL